MAIKEYVVGNSKIGKAMKTSILHKIILFIVIFLYIYNINFVSTPKITSTRTLIGIFGILYFLLKYNTRMNKNVFMLIVLLLLYVVSNAITIIINGTNDFWFSQFAILNILNLFGALWICDYFKTSIKSIDSLLKLIVLCILSHNIIAFLGLVNPQVSDILVNIQNSSQQVKQTADSGVRSIGLGIGQYFFGGVITCYAEIILMYLISRKKISLLAGFVSLLLTAVTGIFIARTSLIGLIISCLFFAKNIYNLLKAGILIFSGGVIVYLIFANWSSDTFNTAWAFEVFMNYADSNRVSTYSTDSLQTMYIFPTSFKTWIFGDGMYENPDGSFYMHTDVGYCRIIFGIGLMGLLFEFINFLYIIHIFRYYSVKKDGLVVFAIICILLLYVLYLKGHTQIYFILYLLLGYLLPTTPINNTLCNENFSYYGGLQCSEYNPRKH